MRRHHDPAIRAGSIWGNPFKDGPSVAILRRYREHGLSSLDLVSQQYTLRGQVLSCWCHPIHCHADILTELDDRLLGGPRSMAAH
jgi:hypothetical protein